MLDTANPVRMVKIADIIVPRNRMRQLRPEKVHEIAESFQQCGRQIQAISLRPNGAGRFELNTGHHRLEAARKLGWDTIRADVVEGLDADAAQLIEIDENLIRADLTDAEAAAHHMRRKQLYLRLHPETKRGGDRRSTDAKSKARNEPLISYTKQAAKEIGKSNATVKRAVARGEKIANVGELAGTVLDSGEELDALAKLPEPVQRDLIERAKAGEKVTAKHVAQKLRRQQREVELAESTTAASTRLGKKLYGVIYADPPWRFELWAESGMDRVADNHYPTLPIDEIAAIKVPAGDNAVLFLWSTAPMLPQAVDVLRAWGFTYKSWIVWEKDRQGTGYWVRNEGELLLIGTRGNIPAPTPGEQPPQFVKAPRREHSRKPDEFYEHIERLFPNTPKLEMFARQARPGWDCWGNEAPCDDDKDEGTL